MEKKLIKLKTIEVPNPSSSKSSNKNYVDPEELQRIILRDLKANKLSQEAKVLIYEMINRYCSKPSWNSYDEDTKRDMSLLAFEYINKYWSSYREYRYKYTIGISDDIDIVKYLKKDKEFRRVKFNIDEKDSKISFAIPEEKVLLLEKRLESLQIKYEKVKLKGNIFAYFTKYIENSFKNHISKKVFHYTKGVTNYNNMVIVSTNKEDDYIPTHKIYNTISDLSVEDNNFMIDESSIKEPVHEDGVLYDRNILIDTILLNSSNIDEIVELSYGAIKHSKKNIKIIYNDKTLLYILLKYKEKNL